MEIWKERKEKKARCLGGGGEQVSGAECFQVRAPGSPEVVIGVPWDWVGGVCSELGVVQHLCIKQSVSALGAEILRLSLR